MKAHHTIIPLLFLAATTVSADTLRIPADGVPADSPGSAPRSVRGMTMDAVLARHGEPRQRLPAVGDPPITRWVYDGFTVYFEGRLALHAVVRKDPRS